MHPWRHSSVIAILVMMLSKEKVMADITEINAEMRSRVGKGISPVRHAAQAEYPRLSSMVISSLR